MAATTLRKGAAVSALLIAVFLVVCGVLLPVQIQKLLDEGIRTNTVWTQLSPPDVDARFRGSESSGSGVMTMRVFLLNLTNVEAVRAGAKPIMAQVGPFLYEHHQQKLDVLFRSDGRVLYKTYNWFTRVQPPPPVPPEVPADAAAHQQQDGGGGRLLQPGQLLGGEGGSGGGQVAQGVHPDAPITTLNLALLGVLAHAHAAAPEGAQPFLDVLAKMMEDRKSDNHTDGLFTTRPASELLWGYDDPLLAAIEPFMPPGSLPSGSRVALLANMSGGEVEALSQATSVADTGLLEGGRTWTIEADRGVSNVTAWACPEPVTGSDGLQFPPGLQPGQRLHVWVADMWRSMWLVPKGGATLHGIKLTRYVQDPADAEPDPCHYQTITGLSNLSSPLGAGPTAPPGAPGAPVFVSPPMFCGADPALRAAVEGLEECGEHHETFVDVEPVTGITLRAAKRMMVSSRIGDLGATLEPGVSGGLTLPMMWAEELNEADAAQCRTLVAGVYRAQAVIAHLGVACYSTAALLLLLGLALLLLPPARARAAGSVDASSGSAGAQPGERAPLLGGSGAPAGVEGGSNGWVDDAAPASAPAGQTSSLLGPAGV